MVEAVFQGLFDSGIAQVISVTDFLLCICVSLATGLILAGAYMFRSRYTKSFVVTLALLPTVVCVVIMMVNGNVGTGVAVAGAFSLVRFRSVPGTAKEITGLFLAMSVGLVAGMGYLGFAVLFAVILSIVSMLYSSLEFGARKNGERYKTLRITLPEDLDYGGVFAPVLEQYTFRWELIHVRTTNMGSMFRLTYQVILRDPRNEKEMIDAIRCRNGNLDVELSRQETSVDAL